MNSDSNVAKITSRLDAIISLLLLKMQEDKMESGKLITSLHNAGMSPSEIGKIMNRKTKDVGAIISMYKKRAEKKRSAKKNE